MDAFKKKNYPNTPCIETLPDGIYNGIQGGYIINVDGIDYFCQQGVRGVGIRTKFQIKNKVFIDLD